MVSRAVLAVYRWLVVPANTASGLVFAWPLSVEPKPGMRVALPTSGGLQDFGVVLRKATSAEARNQMLSPDYTVIRLASESEQREAQEDADDDWARLWKKARIVAGLDPHRGEHLGGFPNYFRTSGASNFDQALVYADRWGKLRRRAAKAGRPAAEINAYERIGNQWKTIYDREVAAWERSRGYR